MATEAAKTQKQSEKIVNEFQSLRNEQRNLVNSLSTLEMDLKEHKTVIETLKTVDENRKCFRLIGGVLCERTVKEVLPQLVENKDYIEKTIVIVSEELRKKGIQLNKFKEENNIRIRGEPIADTKTGRNPDENIQQNRNVLVSN